MGARVRSDYISLIAANGVICVIALHDRDEVTGIAELRVNGVSLVVLNLNVASPCLVS